MGSAGGTGVLVVSVDNSVVGTSDAVRMLEGLTEDKSGAITLTAVESVLAASVLIVTALQAPSLV